MRVLISAAAVALASMALGPVAGIALVHSGDIIVGGYANRRASSSRRLRTSSRPAERTANGPAFLAAAEAKRARKAARRLELAA